MLRSQFIIKLMSLRSCRTSQGLQKMKNLVFACVTVDAEASPAADASESNSRYRNLDISWCKVEGKHCRQVQLFCS